MKKARIENNEEQVMVCLITNYYTGEILVSELLIVRSIWKW